MQGDSPKAVGRLASAGGQIVNSCSHPPQSTVDPVRGVQSQSLFATFFHCPSNSAAFAFLLEAHRPLICTRTGARLPKDENCANFVPRNDAMENSRADGFSLQVRSYFSYCCKRCWIISGLRSLCWTRCLHREEKLLPFQWPWRSLPSRHHCWRLKPSEHPIGAFNGFFAGSVRASCTPYGACVGV